MIRTNFYRPQRKRECRQNRATNDKFKSREDTARWRASKATQYSNYKHRDEEEKNVVREKN